MTKLLQILCREFRGELEESLKRVDEAERTIEECETTGSSISDPIVTDDDDPDVKVGVAGSLKMTLLRCRSTVDRFLKQVTEQKLCQHGTYRRVCRKQQPSVHGAVTNKNCEVFQPIFTDGLFGSPDQNLTPRTTCQRKTANVQSQCGTEVTEDISNNSCVLSTQSNDATATTSASQCAPDVRPTYSRANIKRHNIQVVRRSSRRRTRTVNYKIDLKDEPPSFLNPKTSKCAGRNGRANTSTSTTSSNDSGVFLHKTSEFLPASNKKYLDSPWWSKEMEGFFNDRNFVCDVDEIELMEACSQIRPTMGMALQGEKFQWTLAMLRQDDPNEVGGSQKHRVGNIAAAIAWKMLRRRFGDDEVVPSLYGNIDAFLLNNTVLTGPISLVNLFKRQSKELCTAIIISLRSTLPDDCPVRILMTAFHDCVSNIKQRVHTLKWIQKRRSDQSGSRVSVSSKKTRRANANYTNTQYHENEANDSYDECESTTYNDEAPFVGGEVDDSRSMTPVLLPSPADIGDDDESDHEDDEPPIGATPVQFGVPKSSLKLGSVISTIGRK